jgi:hypothetical protein
MTSTATLPETDTPDLVTHGSGDEQQIHALVARCLEGTVDALRQTGAANDREIIAAYRLIEDEATQSTPIEFLVAVARIQRVDDELMIPAISRLSEAIASTLPTPPPLIPFADKLITPSAFYENFQDLLAMARAIMAPVIFAEDTDAIGVGSVNPFAARLLAMEIRAAVDARHGIKPFVNVVRIDYESWTFLLRKHFAL